MNTFGGLPESQATERTFARSSCGTNPISVAADSELVMVAGVEAKEGPGGVQVGPADAEGLRGEVPVGCLRSTYARR